MSFKYYIYISDLKVDMLLPQVDPRLEYERTTDLSVDFKLFGVSLSRHSRAAERETRVASGRIPRLETLVDSLHEMGVIGSIENPSQFFWGIMPMRCNVIDRGAKTMVYYSGRFGNTSVGLGGSAAHVIGAVPQATGFSELSSSNLMDIEGALQTFLRDAEEDRAVVADDVKMAAINEMIPGSEQNLEFVAKTLYQNALHPSKKLGAGLFNVPSRILLGSPLYVAQAD